MAASGSMTKEVGKGDRAPGSAPSSGTRENGRPNEVQIDRVRRGVLIPLKFPLTKAAFLVARPTRLRRGSPPVSLSARLRPLARRARRRGGSSFLTTFIIVYL